MQYLIQAVASCPELTGLQKVAGFVSWMNILRVFAIVGMVGCAGFLLLKWFRWLLELFLNIPKEVYEVLGYALSIGLVVSTNRFSETNQMWPLLGGSLLFGVMLFITGVLHGFKPKFDQFFGTLFFVWGAIALYYHSSAVGFITAGAFMGMLGFSAMIVPFGYVIGFQDEDALARATPAGLILLASFVGMKISGNVPSMRVFDIGALWFGSFVGYLGLLIGSSKWYEAKKANYVLMQIITIAFGMVAIAVGSVWNIGPLLGVGGTFFVLYLVEKPFEIPAENATQYALIGLTVSAVLGGGVWWAQNHMELVRPYLLF